MSQVRPQSHLSGLWPPKHLTNRCSRRLAGLFPPFFMIKNTSTHSKARSRQAVLSSSSLDLVRKSSVQPGEFAVVASVVAARAIAGWIFGMWIYPFNPLLGIISSAIYVTCFWLRYNWARWATIIVSVVTLLNALPNFHHVTRFKLIGDLIQVPLAVF